MVVLVLSEKDENFNPPVEMMQEGNFEKIEKTIDVWYEGVMVMGTNILYNGECLKIWLDLSLQLNTLYLTM